MYFWTEREIQCRCVCVVVCVLYVLCCVSVCVCVCVCVCVQEREVEEVEKRLEAMRRQWEEGNISRHVRNQTTLLQKGRPIIYCPYL